MPTRFGIEQFMSFAVWGRGGLSTHIARTPKLRKDSRPVSPAAGTALFAAAPARDKGARLELSGDCAGDEPLPFPGHGGGHEPRIRREIRFCSDPTVFAGDHGALSSGALVRMTIGASLLLWQRTGDMCSAVRT